MNELLLSIEDGRIAGRGVDIVAPFQMTGNVREDGTVEIIKKYEQRHTVLYVGQYDGEGTLYGDWDISGYQGKWSIKLLRPASGISDSIEEIAPRG
jgi:hypothetical protein